MFRVYVILPLLPAFEGQLGTPTGMAMQAVINWNLQSIIRGGTSLLEKLIKEGEMATVIEQLLIRFAIMCKCICCKGDIDGTHLVAGIEIEPYKLNSP